MKHTALAALLAAAHSFPAAAAADAPATIAAATGGDAATSGDVASSSAAPDPGDQADATATTPPADGTRNGLEIYTAFREGLAEPECTPNDHARWRRHFAHAPARLAATGSDALPLFGHVVDALREAHLPTEFALIPFIESGYAPGVHGRGGPAGLWQFMAVTARNHGIQVGSRYDGRLSPAESTRAAVRYLKTLNGMFGGNWRLTAMAYNAGEYRVLQALRRSGSSFTEARPGALPGLSPITYAYVEKLHALACLLEQADDRQAWLDGLDRPVMRLQAVELDAGPDLRRWAVRNGHAPDTLLRLNPALAAGRWPAKDRPVALVPMLPGGDASPAPVATAATQDDAGGPPANGRSYVVRRGDSLWSIAQRQGVRLERLRELNSLGPRGLIRPGMVLRLE